MSSIAVDLSVSSITGSWEDYHGQPAEINKNKAKAYCNSSSCFRGPRGETKNSCGVEKVTSPHAVFCPDCESALFWMRPNKLHARKNMVVSSRKSRYSKGA